MSEYLYQEGIASEAVLNPAVPDNESRVRFLITSEDSDAQIEKTVDVIANFANSSDQVLESS
jgi:7-keto-8-aminopelargonate synthetase-like enzyme